MQQSAGDTFVRAVVMGAVLVALVWAANRYTTIPRLLIQRLIHWYETSAAVSPDGGNVELASSAIGEPTQAHVPGLLSNRAQEAQPIGVVVQRSIANQTDISRNPGGSEGATSVGYQTSIVSPTVGVGPAGTLDRRTQIERRLETLGAVYTLMEMWGRDDRRYRFHCRVALAGGAEVTRNFEATGAGPQDVMEEVLVQVEAWWAQMSFAERNTP